MTEENRLLYNKHILVCITSQMQITMPDFDYVKANFCGKVVETVAELSNYDTPDIIVYMCGDIAQNRQYIKHARIFIISPLSYNFSQDSETVITLGSVPINVHNVGVFFRDFFDSGRNYYEAITAEHKFQTLTESNKPSNAFRKGIYLTNVKQDGAMRRFNLLRCSTNLSGPTDNFRRSDHEIINKINDIGHHFFETRANVNHVLAQIYVNSKPTWFMVTFARIMNFIWMGLFGKVFYNIAHMQKKAKIKAHSDKTKDMPRNGIMAFCSFYKNDERLAMVKPSYCIGGVSVLTRLRFKLKPMVNNAGLAKDFDVTLYPNSLLLIPLSTNRIYTHEIKPSSLDVDKLPTRMGYIVRCSNTVAVFKDGQTYIDVGEKHVRMRQMTDSDAEELRHLYFTENSTTDVVEYGPTYFSMNKGDYRMPLV